MKNTKKSLLASGLALLASVALLAGTTFAWFTDSVTNSGNKIQAGSLKVDLLQLSDTLNDGQKTALGDDLPADGVYVSIADVKAPIFDYDLWEPGYTDFVALEVSNTGSLALKWKLELIANGAAGILGDVIDVYAKVSDSAITKPETFAAIQADGEYRLVGTLNELIADPDGAAYGVLYAAADADKPGASAMYAGIALHMRETAGNDYQGESIGTTFDLMLNATQYTYEKDGFENDQYDKEAEKELLIGASVKGVAGFEDIVFDSIQEAYAAISPVVNALAGLEQDGVANNEAGNAKFDAVFTDNGIITWTIYGKQTVDNSLLFSFGRKASYYNPSRSIQSLRIVGGNSSAKLVMDQSIVLPYN